MYQQVSGSSIKASVRPDRHCTARLRTNAADVNRMKNSPVKNHRHKTTRSTRDFDTVKICSSV